MADPNRAVPTGPHALFLIDGSPAAVLSAAEQGPHSVAICFANQTFHFTGLSAGQRQAVVDRYGPLVVAGVGNTTDGVVVRTARPERFARVATAGWEYAPAFEPRAAEVVVSGLWWTARLNRTPNGLAGDVAVADRGRDDFLQAFENVFRIVAAYRLVHCGGVVLHGAGVVDRGRARVFFGRSGAGKTTLCGTCEQHGRQILSDELNAVRLDGSGLAVEAMPFAGDFGAQAPLAASFPLDLWAHLSQGPRDTITRLATARAVAAVARCAPFVNGDPFALDRLLDVTGQLVSAQPIHALTLTLGADPFSVTPPEWRGHVNSTV